MFNKLKLFLEKKFTQLTLVTIYFIGIGPTAVIAKVLGKKFLVSQNNNKNSNWQEKNTNYDRFKQLNKMY